VRAELADQALRTPIASALMPRIGRLAVDGGSVCQGRIAREVD